MQFFKGLGKYFFSFILNFPLELVTFTVILQRRWRGGRVVEGARLERVYTGDRIKGSNPFLSAIILKKILYNQVVISFWVNLFPHLFPHRKLAIDI